MSSQSDRTPPALISWHGENIIYSHRLQFAGGCGTSTLSVRWEAHKFLHHWTDIYWHVVGHDHRPRFIALDLMRLPRWFPFIPQGLGERVFKSAILFAPVIGGGGAHLERTTVEPGVYRHF